jgi:hypothetical protein
MGRDGVDAHVDDMGIVRIAGRDVADVDLVIPHGDGGDGTHGGEHDHEHDGGKLAFQDDVSSEKGEAWFLSINGKAKSFLRLDTETSPDRATATYPELLTQQSGF